MRLGGLVMGLIKIRIGDYFEPYSCYCGISNLSNDDISGINSEKEFFEPSHQVGSDTSKYKVVPPNYFACNLMHVGRDIVLPIALNHTDKNRIVSPAYNIFRIIENDVLDVEYFFILLKSQERDRYFWFYTDSSVRDGLTWDEFCNMELELPPIEIQQKYVDIYNAMLANQQSYEAGLEDLKTSFLGYIEMLRRESKDLERIGNYIEPYNEKNSNEEITLEQGINIEKQFITPQRSNSNLSGRKIVRNGMIAYCTQLNNANVAVAYREGPDCVVSSVYDVLKITSDALLPKYLMLWLVRPEFGRYVYWASEGSAYEFLNYNNLADYRIPIPEINVQRSIVEIYESYNTRKEIMDSLKKLTKDICPILIKGSIDEAKKEA